MQPRDKYRIDAYYIKFMASLYLALCLPAAVVSQLLTGSWIWGALAVVAFAAQGELRYHRRIRGNRRSG